MESKGLVNGKQEYDNVTLTPLIALYGVGNGFIEPVQPILCHQTRHEGYLIAVGHYDAHVVGGESAARQRVKFS